MNPFLLSYEAYSQDPVDGKGRSLAVVISGHKVEDEDIPALLKLIQSAPHARLRLMAFIALRQAGKIAPELQQLWNLEAAQIKSLIEAEHRQARFPIVNPHDEALMAELFIFTFEAETPRAICLYPAAADAAQELANICNCSFLIGFSENFEGNSWLCAAAAALKCKDPAKLRPLAFTGELDASGNLHRAGYLDAKRQAAEKHGLRLISSIKSLQELDFLLNEPTLPLPVIQTAVKSGLATEWLDWMEAAIRAENPHFNLDAVMEMGGLQAEDLLIFHEGYIPFEPEFWQEYLQANVKHKFDYLQSRFPSPCLIWYAGMISSMQFAIGVSFGFKRPICICHWDSTQQKYLPMIKIYGETPVRTLKNVNISPRDLRYIDYETIDLRKEQSTVALIIYLASHNPISEARHHAKTVRNTEATIIISLKSGQGQLQNDDDWLLVVREIYSLINHLKNDHNWQKMLIYPSAPAAVCMALGIALGHFWDIEIMHYNGGSVPKYKAMYNLMDFTPA